MAFENPEPVLYSNSAFSPNTFKLAFNTQFTKEKCARDLAGLLKKNQKARADYLLQISLPRFSESSNMLLNNKFLKRISLHIGFYIDEPNLLRLLKDIKKNMEIAKLTFEGFKVIYDKFPDDGSPNYSTIGLGFSGQLDRLNYKSSILQIIGAWYNSFHIKRT